MSDDYYLTTREQQLIAQALNLMASFSRDFSQDEITEILELAKDFS